jgi:hypothetical protein
MLLLAVALTAEGAVTFGISNGSEAGMYTVSAGGGQGLAVATDVPMDSAINIIRVGADGKPVEIKFLSKNGGTVDLGDDGVSIIRWESDLPTWSDSITFSGKTKGGSFSVWGRPVIGDVYLKNTANMEFVKGGFTVEASVVLELEACTLSTEGKVLVMAQHTMWTGGPRVVKVKGGKYTSRGRVISANCDVEISSGIFNANGFAAVVAGGYVTIISGGEFTSDSSYAVEANGRELTITGGKFVSRGSFPTIRVRYGNFAISGGTFESSFNDALYADVSGEITGGTFESKGGGSALVAASGTVLASGGHFFNNSDTGAAITLSGGSASLGNVEVKNKSPGGRAVKIFSPLSKFDFTGATRFSGTLASRYADAISVGASFNPGVSVEKYKLELSGSACIDGAVAVAGGGPQSTLFEMSNAFYELGTSGKDIVVKLKSGVKEQQFTVGGNGITGLTANYIKEDGNNVEIRKSAGIDSILTAISDSAAGRPCRINFQSVNMGVTTVTIDGAKEKRGWGKVTLSGNIIVGAPNIASAVTGALTLQNGVYVESSLEINSTHAYGVDVGAGSEFAYYGDSGKTCEGIRNYGGIVNVVRGWVRNIDNEKGGWLTVSGGTVGSDTLSRVAIKNEIGSQAVISDSAYIVSADTRAAGGTIANSGNLIVSGGKVSNAAGPTSGAASAINNGPGATDTAATVRILGTTAKISSSGAGESGVVCNNRGQMAILGGHIFSADSTTNNVVFNRGKLTIAGGTVIETKGNYNINHIGATIYSETDSADVRGGGNALEITGGTIKAKDGYAVSIKGSGGALIAGTADISAEKPDGVVYIGQYATLKLYGGKVWSNSLSDSAIAIDAYQGSYHYNSGAGKLEMGGSPDVDGLIALLENYNLPIKINTGGEYAFNPPKGRVYKIAASVWNETVVVGGGLAFRRNFALDTMLIKSNADFGLAVSKNDIVAANAIRFVAFSLNGAIGGDPPDTIFVLRGGKIGESAKPETKSYASKDGRSNDGNWYVRDGFAADGSDKHNGQKFDFGITPYNSVVDNDITLTLNWVGQISVLSPSRAVPPGHTAESAVVAPVAVTASGSLTAGPNPVLGYAGAIGLFWSGAPLRDGKLFIYDATGNAIAKVDVSDNSGGAGRRRVAAWDLRDAKGRLAAEGTYAAKGVVTARSGRAERVSMLLSVQR